MSIIWRSWLSVSLIMGFMLGILGVLISLQHDAILAALIKQRLAVVAQSTANSFQPALDIGLPVSMLRNTQALLDRARGSDPNAPHIWIIDNTGSLSGSSPPTELQTLHSSMLRIMHGSTRRWTHETDDVLFSGINLQASDNSLVGAILVSYSKQRFNAISQSLSHQLILGGLVIWAFFASMAWLLLYLKLRDASRGYNQILELLHQFSALPSEAPFPSAPRAAGSGFFAKVIPDLYQKLAQAEVHYRQQQTSVINESGIQFITVYPQHSSLAYLMIRHLSPSIATLLLASVLSFGFYAYHETQKSFEPEQSARLELIGVIANADIQRAVNAGIPLEKLVGTGHYFNELLGSFPEVSYFGILSDHILVEAGTRQQSAFWSIGSHDLPALPITDGRQQIGEILIKANPHYFSLQFRDVLLDLSVIILVAILLASQVLVVTFSTSLTGPFYRLEYLISRQANGDFSIRLNQYRHSEIDRAARFLSQRAEQMAVTAAGLHKTVYPPRILQFAYLNDIRLPVFLFAGVDALSISFLPVYTRSLHNSFDWLDGTLAISLPLAGYLLAITLASPFVRPLLTRFGHKPLLLWTTVLGLCAYFGLWASTTVVELTIYRTLSGLTFALATLTCQDYTLDIAHKSMRSQALGFFTSALFSGIFTGAAVGGILADRLGASSVFAIGGTGVMIAGVLVTLLLPRHQQTEQVHRSLRIRLWQPMQSARFCRLVTCVAIPSNVLVQAFIAFLLALQLDQLGASAADIGRILMLFYLTILVLSAVAPRLLSPHFNDWQISFIGLITSSLALAAAATWPTFWSIASAAMAAGVGQALIRDPEISLALSLAENELRHLGSDTVLSSLRSLERAGSLAGLVLIALLSSRQGYPVAIATISIWLALGAACILMARKHLD